MSKQSDMARIAEIAEFAPDRPKTPTMLGQMGFMEIPDEDEINPEMLLMVAQNNIKVLKAELANLPALAEAIPKEIASLQAIIEKYEN